MSHDVDFPDIQDLSCLDVNTRIISTIDKGNPKL